MNPNRVSFLSRLSISQSTLCQDHSGSVDCVRNFFVSVYVGFPTNQQRVFLLFPCLFTILLLMCRLFVAFMSVSPRHRQREPSFLDNQEQEPSFLDNQEQKPFHVIRNRNLLSSIIRNRNLHSTIIRIRNLLSTIIRNRNLLSTIIRNRNLLSTIIRNRNLRSSILRNWNLRSLIIRNWNFCPSDDTRLCNQVPVTTSDRTAGPSDIRLCNQVPVTTSDRTARSQ